jgi:DNA-binding transcriptional ArsR family regulator
MDEAALGRAAAVLGLLGVRTRLRVVALLADAELCVEEVQATLGLTQPSASFHLGVLRRAGLVRAQRRAQRVYYALDPAGWERAAAAIRAVPSPTAPPR